MTNGEIILKLIKDVTGVELELGEEFELLSEIVEVSVQGISTSISGKYDTYCIKHDGIYYQDELCNIPINYLTNLLTTIKIKNKFPKDGTKYYWVSPDSSIYGLEFWKSTIDVLNYKTGNFFLTREEAEQNKEKIMKILNSPERFELK